MSLISRSLVLLPGVVALFVACSSSTTTPDADAGTNDASTSADTSVTPIPTNDAAPGQDAAKPDSSTPGNCKNNGFTSVATDGFVLANGDVGVSGQSTLASPVDTLELSILPLTGTSVVAEKRTLAAGDGSYATCKTCVLIRTKCDENLANCQKRFIATAGTLDILNAPAKNAKFQVKANVTMVEVTIANDNTTTPVPNGETWCLTNQEFTVDSMQ